MTPDNSTIKAEGEEQRQLIEFLVGRQLYV